MKFSFLTKSKNNFLLNKIINQDLKSNNLIEKCLRPIDQLFFWQFKIWGALEGKETKKDWPPKIGSLNGIWTKLGSNQPIAKDLYCINLDIYFRQKHVSQRLKYYYLASKLFQLWLF